MTGHCVQWQSLDRQLEIVACSHSGLRRSNNEDSFAVDVSSNLMLLADGIGGHHAGETASAMAITHTLQTMQRGTDIEQAIWHAHQQTVHAAQSNKRLKDMGATLICAQWQSPQLTLNWVGDSRAYLFDPQRPALCLLSRDHTMLQHLIEQGESISEQVARQYAHVLTTAIGSPQFQPDHVEQRVTQWPAEQLLLICSDGLSDMLSNNQLTNILMSDRRLDTLADRLLAAALAAGGKDNVTLILARRVPSIN